MSPKVNRREFVKTSTAASLVAAAPFAQGPTMMTPSTSKPVVISSANGNVFKNGGTVTCVEKAFTLITQGSDVLDATFYALTLGTISLLVAYVLATVGAIRFLFFDGEPKAPLWQAVIPTLGGAFVIYTIYKNVVHVPSPYSYFGWLVLIWLLIGLAIVAFVPGLARRVRIGLAQSSAP